MIFIPRREELIEPMAATLAEVAEKQEHWREASEYWNQAYQETHNIKYLKRFGQALELYRQNIIARN